MLRHPFRALTPYLGCLSERVNPISRIDRVTVAALLAAHLQGLEFGTLRVLSYLRQRIALEYINCEAMRGVVRRLHPCILPAAHRRKGGYGVRDQGLGQGRR